MTRYWFPYGAREQWDRPEPGSLVATRSAVYRIIEYRPYPDDQQTDAERARVEQHGERVAPYHVVVRPAHITATDPRARDHDLSYSIRGDRVGRIRWRVYPDEHYPVCGTCGEPSPCREREATRETEWVMGWMARYEDPTKCPGCLKTVTKRGRHITFPNVHVPWGPPVTFHLRGNCAGDARDYEQDVVRLDPAYRAVLFCEGRITAHVDGREECSRGAECPGSVDHRSFGRCYRCTDTACRVGAS